MKKSLKKWLGWISLGTLSAFLIGWASFLVYYISTDLMATWFPQLTDLQRNGLLLGGIVVLFIFIGWSGTKVMTKIIKG